MKRVLLQHAYVLHRRHYRESSFLVELITPEYGRLTVVAKGYQSNSMLQGLLQSFVPLLVSFSGRDELMTLLHVEINGPIKYLRGECLIAGFYLHELLIGLLQKWDAHPKLYFSYENTLHALQVQGLEEKILRSFEKILLEELGYGLLPKDKKTLQDTFLPNKYYRFIPEHGFVISELGDLSQANSTIFSGKSLLAIAKDDWQSDSVLLDAKRLTRCILLSLLAKPIHSKRLFQRFC